MPLTRLGWVATLVVAACSGTDPVDDTADPVADLEPAIELGTGESDFEPLVDGGDVVIVYGPQGGYHLNGSLRAQGVVPGDTDHLDDPDNPLTIFTVTRPSGDRISGLEGDDQIMYRQGLDPTDEAGIYEMVGRRVLLDIVSDEEIEGELLTVEVEIQDVDGVSVHDQREVVAVPHPLNDN